MPPKKGGTKRGKGGKKDKGADVDPTEVVTAFQKHYTRLSRERGLDALRLGAAEDNGVLSVEQVFTKVVLHPHMVGPTCELPHLVTLLDALAFYKHLRHLCIWQIPLGDDGCARLGRFLRSSKTVARVELLSCSIGGEGCALIGAAIQQSPVLSRLALDHNQIRNAGVNAMRASLESNSVLQSLSLRFCGVTPSGAEQCARLIATCRLKDLDLHGNELQALGAAMCLVALRDNAHITRIGLACTTWGAEGAVTQALINTMEANTTCNEYNIDGNPIGDANALKIAAALRQTAHVTAVVTTDQLTPAVFHEIAKLADANLKEWLKKHKKKRGKKGGKRGKKGKT
ncbi:hypothetical protein KFE25_009381 [Diacronema lutheri]|uniref:Uncharacterized protein n=1 Tax=Diacronema lutheri TaxID=2081491 RepID=A0A8J6CI44_DIALT|nr:hypothetical protein KFE25_009381 [Diacronema lutheri]